MLTARDIVHVFPSCGDPDTWAQAIEAAWQRFGIASRNARAGFLGIIGNETGGLREVTRENMNYSYARAVQVWPGKAGPEMHEAIRNGPVAFASFIYGGIIGNGGRGSGDGWKYRGGGIIQMTGRANYRACGKALGIDLEADPDRIVEPEISALAAAWYMAQYKPECLRPLNSDSEADFIAGARIVGFPPDGATERRLAYRRKALEVVVPAGYVREGGNVKRADIRQSTIVSDSNKGATVATVAAAAGAAAPVVTAIGGMQWEVAAVLGVVVLGLAGMAVWYFLRVKKRRRKMAQEGIA